MEVLNGEHNKTSQQENWRHVRVFSGELLGQGEEGSKEQASLHGEIGS